MIAWESDFSPMLEWVAVLIEVVKLIVAYPLAGGFLAILIGAGAVFAVLIRRTRPDESLTLR
jgi:hypothetical protein